MKVVDVLSSKVYSSGERIIAQVWLIGVDFSIEPHPMNFCAIYGVFTLWIWWVFFPNFFLASVITSVSSLVYSGPVTQNRHDPCKCTDHNRISDPAKIFFGMERVVYSVPWSDWTFFRACLSLILQHEQTCISRKDSFRSHNSDNYGTLLAGDIFAKVTVVYCAQPKFAYFSVMSYFLVTS